MAGQNGGARDLTHHRNGSGHNGAYGGHAIYGHSPTFTVGLRAIQADAAPILSVGYAMQREKCVHQSRQRLGVALMGSRKMSNGLIELTAHLPRGFHYLTHIGALIDLRR
ncbi:hypothetical protein B1F85_31755 (plasmid) [Pseudomonas syringae pv. actinidiae]|nr:hypothetical protein B1F85_31755 [Pseudomonas syringae pv. actinidiae]